MTEEHILEYEIIEEENGSLLVAEGYSWRGFADELQELHYLKGARFINQLKLIVYYGGTKYMRSDYCLALTRKRSLDFQDELKKLFS